MWGFKKKDEKLESVNPKHVNSYEYEALSKRLSETNTDVATLKGNVKVLETDLANLRGKFNQRLRGLTEPQQQDNEPRGSGAEPTENIKSGEPVFIG